MTGVLRAALCRHLLYEASAGLAEGISDNVDGGLSLRLLLGVEWDVRHLLARVEQRVPSDGVVGHGTLRVDDGWCGGQWTMAGRRRVELQVGGVVAAVADDVRVGGKQLGACAM